MFAGRSIFIKVVWKALRLKHCLKSHFYRDISLISTCIHLHSLWPALIPYLQSLSMHETSDFHEKFNYFTLNIPSTRTKLQTLCYLRFGTREFEWKFRGISPKTGCHSKKNRYLIGKNFILHSKSLISSANRAKTKEHFFKRVSKLFCPSQSQLPTFFEFYRSDCC